MGHKPHWGEGSGAAWCLGRLLADLPDMTCLTSVGCPAVRTAQASPYEASLHFSTSRPQTALPLQCCTGMTITTSAAHATTAAARASTSWGRAGRRDKGQELARLGVIGLAPVLMGFFSKSRVAGQPCCRRPPHGAFARAAPSPCAPGSRKWSRPRHGPRQMHSSPHPPGACGGAWSARPGCWCVLADATSTASRQAQHLHMHTGWVQARPPARTHHLFLHPVASQRHAALRVLLSRANEPVARCLAS